MHHILLVCFFSQGNVNPFLRLAKRFASKGLLVTLSSTSEIGNQLAAATGMPTSGETIPVGEGHVRFEFFSIGKENHNKKNMRGLEDAMTMLETSGPIGISDIIRRQADAGRPVRCIIGNPFIPWVIDVGAELGIPCGILWVQSCAVFSIYYHHQHNLVEFPTAEKRDLLLELPGIQSLQLNEIPSVSLHPSLTSRLVKLFQKLPNVRFVLVNSFRELEGEVLADMSSRLQLLPVGPLVDLGHDGSELSGDLIRTVPGCVDWLDSQPQNSVVYVSVGSIVKLEKDDVEEMALGLRNSKKRFLWVVRDDTRDLLPDGFAEETKDRGLVVSWCPQDQVLQHGSVGCFLTHCGWNSTSEAITYGVPVIAFPDLGDQYTNAKLMVDVCGIGVHVRRKEKSGHSKVSIAMDDIVRAVEEVLEGRRAEEMRKNAAKWRAMACAAVGKGGSSEKNFLAVVEDILRST